MSYIEGFVLAVPTANKDRYCAMARQALPVFKEFGMKRLVEAWGDDVPKGKVTDFQGAVQAKDEETVLFSWMEYPDKATRDAATQKMMSDPRMESMPEMPFDAKRMIFAGFTPFVEQGPGGRTGYIDGYLLPVTESRRADYRQLAEHAAGIFVEHGALRVVEAWGDDVQEGKITDFRRAVQARPDERIVYSWVEWPSKQARDEGMRKVMEDERMKMDEKNLPFDGQRMIFGGFVPVVDE